MNILIDSDSDSMIEFMTPNFIPLEEIPVCENKKFLKKNYKKTYFENHVHAYIREYMKEKEVVSKNIYLFEKKINKLNYELRKVFGALTQWQSHYGESFEKIVEECEKKKTFGYYRNYLYNIPVFESQLKKGRKKENEILMEIKNLKSEIERLEGMPKVLSVREFETITVDNRNRRTRSKHVAKFIPTVEEYLDLEKVNFSAEVIYLRKEADINSENFEIWGMNNNPSNPNNFHQQIGEIIDSELKPKIEIKVKFNHLLEEECDKSDYVEPELVDLDQLDDDYIELCENNEDMFSLSEDCITYTNNTRYPNSDELASIPKFNLYPGMPSHFFSWYVEEFLHFGEDEWNVVIESQHNHSEEIFHKLETQKRFMTNSDKERMKRVSLV